MKEKEIIQITKKDHLGIHAYLKSKEIYDWLVKRIYFYDEDKVEAEVESKTSDEKYWVYIDLKRDIYFCTCNSWVFKRYEIELPKKGFWRKTIALCPHIIKVLTVIDKIKKRKLNNIKL